MEKKLTAKKPAPSSDTARKIWLAGIGAYGRAFSEAQETVAKLTGDSARVFDELVARGEEIERKVEEKGRKVAAQVTPSLAPLDDRIRKMRERIGLGDARRADDDELDELRARVAALEAEVESLKSKGARKSLAKKKSV